MPTTPSVWLLKAFGEQLRSLRERRNLAQERLAEVANVHRNEIGILERGSAIRACRCC